MHANEGSYRDGSTPKPPHAMLIILAVVAAAGNGLWLAP